MKSVPVCDLGEDSNIEDITTGIAYLTFQKSIQKWLESVQNKEEILILSLTSLFDGVRMHKHSKQDSEVFIWYSTINEIKTGRTKEGNIIILALLEKKKNMPFDDDLLIPLYSQMYKLSTEGAKRMVYGGEEKLLKVYFLHFTNDIPICPFFFEY